MKLFPLAAVAAAAIALVVFVALGRPSAARSASSSRGDSITVTGVGEATVAPDQATFDFVVETTGATAREALAANATQTHDVLFALEKNGVRPADIQTQDVSTYSRAPDQSGFAASHDLVVLVRDLPKAGTIVDAGVASGADQVSGPTFSRSDKDALYRDALRAALAQARAKAQALAEASHVALGSVTKVEEQTDAGYVPFASDQQMYSSARAVAKTPIAKGRQKTEATVDVTFAIA
jgi:uncharacterized protein YggE